MNIRYTILALMLGSQMSVAQQPIGVEPPSHTAPVTSSHTELPTSTTPTLELSDALAEKLDRQLEESTAKQPLPKVRWVSANVSPGR